MGGAQLMLKWLRTGAWPKLTDILAAIRQELQSVQPIDTASIRWEKDAEGMKAYYTGRTGGGEGLTVDEGGDGGGEVEGYNGKFKVGLIEDKLYIYDGANKENSNAGTIIAGATYVAFPKTELSRVDGDIYVILAWHPQVESTPGYWETSYHQGDVSTSQFVNNPRAAHFLIATLIDNTITQHHVSGDIYVTGRWL